VDGAPVAVDASPPSEASGARGAPSSTIAPRGW